MLYALHVSENVDPIPLVQACLCATSVRESSDFRVCTFWTEEKHICSSIGSNPVDMADHARSNFVGGAVNDQIRINVDDRGPLVMFSTIRRLAKVGSQVKWGFRSISLHASY